MCLTGFVLILVGSLTVCRGLSTDDHVRIVDCWAACLNDSCRNACTSVTNTSWHIPHIAENTLANISLHCVGINTMMISHDDGTYIIETSEFNSSWAKPRVSNGSLSTFSNLTAGTLYRYRFWKLTEQGVLLPEVSEWFATYEVDYVPEDVPRVFLDKIQSLGKGNNRLRATIFFEPAEDRSCYYNVLSWSGAHNLINFNVEQPVHFSFNLDHLSFDENNTVSISSSTEVGDKTSSRTSFTFATPSCLNVYSDLRICTPEKVEGLRVENVHKHGSMYDVFIYWDKPNFEPDNYTIQIDSFQEEFRLITVPGSAVEVSVLDIELGPQYEISIVAESEGGTSPKITASMMLESPTDADFVPSYREIIIITPMFVTIAILGIIIYLRQQKQKVKHNNLQYAQLKECGVKSVKQFKSNKEFSVESDDAFLPNDKFEISPERLTIKNVLGVGAYGIVKLGALRDAYDGVTNVAVKMLKDNPSTADIKSFHQEILIMKSTGQHPNVVSFIGYCTLYKKPILIVEYCCKGDLQTYLRAIWTSMANIAVNRKTRFPFSTGTDQAHYQNFRTIANHLYDIQQDILHCAENITAADLLNFARQVATGMEFLSSNRIVHRDLAARNVLLGADKVVKISDFGLSRDVYHDNVYRKQGNGKLPLKWMAIEALTHQVYTTYSDVWSFGILIWEIVTLGGMPYPGTPANRILSLLKSGYRMEKPCNCGIELYNLMYACWNARPQSRPTFTELRRSLDKLLSTYSENKYLSLSDVVQDSGK